METVINISLLTLSCMGIITQIFIGLVLLRLLREIEKQHNQPIILWDQDNTEVLLRRRGLIRNDGVFTFWGDGNEVLDLKLKEYAGRQPWLVLVDEM